MPKTYRNIDITFSKSEIQAILFERARELMLKRGGMLTVELAGVEDVEGQATVRLALEEAIE